MHGDFTRVTFDPRQHYSSVRMQQGRVQLDADWNEQLDITAHRVQTEARDLIGRCGAPLHEAGLGIAAAAGDLPASQQAAANQLPFQPGDLFISAGRYYVAGILCENEQPALGSRQPDLPVDAPIVHVGNELVKLVPPPAGVYLVYVDVWCRHLTSLEAPHILETALGGPDTCTRTKSVWQVKLLRAGNVGANIHCASEIAAWGQVTSKPTGQLSARAEPGAVSTDPCIVAPGAGYRRLENQLYRVEVHKSGTLGSATFKWSRDNGSILTKWEQKNGDDLTVASIGRDKVLGLAGGQWIELTDDDREQLGQSGTLVQLIKAEGKVLTIDPATATGPVDLASFKTNPKIRRWDSAGALNLESPAANSGFLPLESGIEVKFTDGNYRTGDYWLIPARTATGQVEWPKEAISDDPIPQRPHGIDHHYCRLAVAQFNAGQWTILSDCRELFPPVTELLHLEYVGGDGQEVKPDPMQPNQLLPLPRPLEVGVSRGRWPVAGARVRFAVKQGNGKVPGNGIITTASDGIAACPWQLDSTTLVQQVEATLLDASGQSVHLPVRFTARLSVASQVAYNPKDCPTLAGVTDVQAAIDKLCQATHSGCCCVTVGKNGEFKTIEEAVKALLEKKSTDWCLCLLPGAHESAGMEIGANPNQPPLHLRISGCGLGTRLTLKQPIQLFGFGSFTLRDLAIQVNDVPQPIQTIRCGEVSVEGCQLVQTLGTGNEGLLTIVEAERFRLHDSVVEQYVRGGQERLRRLLEADPALAGAFSAAGRSELTGRVSALAGPLARETPAKRVAMAETLERSIDRLAGELGATVVESARQYSLALRTDRVTSAVLTSRLVGIWEAAAVASPGIAVVIVGGAAEASISNNQLVGIVSLFGPPAAVDWSFDELKKLGELLKQGAVTFAPDSGSFRLHANQLTRLAVDEKLVLHIKGLVAAGGGKIDRVFQTSVVSENIFLAGPSQVVSQEVSLTSNGFERLSGGDAGRVISQFAVFVGNHAREVGLLNVRVKSERTANLNVSIADL